MGLPTFLSYRKIVKTAICKVIIFVFSRARFKENMTVF